MQIRNAFRDTDTIEPETAVLGASGARGSEGTRAGETTALASYFRDMGRYELIDARRERRLARAIERSRKVLNAVARRLPADCLRTCLGADLDLERFGSWTLADIARFCERLARYRPPAVSKTRVAALQHRARVHAARIARAREEFIAANLRLVVHVAKKCARRGAPLQDMVQEGNIGLIRAVEIFDWRHGNKFSTYAHWWIRQSIERAIANTGRLIRIPIYMNERRRKVLQAVRRLERRLGRRPSPAEVAELLELETEQVEQALAVVADPKSLDEMAESEETGDPLQIIEDPRAVSPLDSVEREDSRRALRRSLRSDISERERRVLEFRFGVGGGNDGDGLTLEKVGRVVNVSRERVRQIEREALKKLREASALSIPRPRRTPSRRTAARS